jgi:hypothetical protein
VADLAGDYAAWTYFQSVATPENEEFVQRFHERYPQRSITDPMETAYLAVKLWARAVNEAQSLDPKKIRRAMLNQRLKGPEGEVRIDPDTQYCFRTPRIGAIQADGQFKIVWTAQEPLRPEPYPTNRTPPAARRRDGGLSFMIFTSAGAIAGPRPNWILPGQRRPGDDLATALSCPVSRLSLEPS